MKKNLEYWPIAVWQILRGKPLMYKMHLRFPKDTSFTGMIAEETDVKILSCCFEWENSE